VLSRLGRGREKSAAAYAKKIFMDKIEIRTNDGTCPSYIYRPAASGPWPAVVVFMDGLGIRPAMLEIGERLAAHGYYVLLPDLFYRSGLASSGLFSRIEPARELVRSSTTSEYEK
jgi:dienelactone hydrolase